MKTRWTSVALAVLCLAALPTAVAVAESQEEAEAEAEAPAGPSFRPIEIYACNFNEGQTMADLMEVTAAWNAWMDEEGRTGYWASLLVPMYHSTEITFDIGWVGGWESGAAMAESTEFWINNGGEHQAAFQRVVDCNIHTNFAVLTVQPNPNPFQPGPVEFTDCTVEEGKQMSDAAGAVQQWAAHEGEKGITAGHFMLFPAFGESSDAEYSFKWVSVYSYDAFGSAYDDFGSGGGWRKYGELFGDLMDCDSSRLYHATTVREVELGE
jgi:hypothetical protein